MMKKCIVLAAIVLAFAMLFGCTINVNQPAAAADEAVIPAVTEEPAATAEPVPEDLTKDLELQTLSGTVVTLLEDSIYIQMENGNTVSFGINFIDNEAAEGDKVEVSYYGDILQNPEAAQITVLEKSEGQMIAVIVYSVHENGFLAQISEDEAAEFITTPSTEILLEKEDATYHLATVCAGDYVVVTYEGSLYETPIVTEILYIDSVDFSDGQYDTDKEKTQSGEVIKLTANKVTLLNSKGHKCNFLMNNKTKVKGGNLQVGSTVTVTYTGDLSDTPLAISIKITDDPDPVKTRTKKGTVVAFGGMALTLDNGFTCDVTYADFGGNGDRVPGETATVRYYTEKGVNYATYVSFKAAKEIENYTTYGTVRRFEGGFLYLTNGNAFDCSHTTFAGSGSGEPGESAEVSYQIGSDGVYLATRVVLTANDPEPIDPVTRPEDCSGTVKSYSGSTLKLTNGMKFDCSNASVYGTGWGASGEGVDVTYYELNGVKHAVKIVFFAVEEPEEPIPEPKPDPEPEPEPVYPQEEPGYDFSGED